MDAKVKGLIRMRLLNLCKFYKEESRRTFSCPEKMHGGTSTA